MTEKTWDYSPAHRALEILSIAAMVLLVGTLDWRLWVMITSAATAWTFACVGIAAYLAADLGSGIVHWMADRYGTCDTILVGPNLVRPFREHHSDPEDITRHDFVETNGNNCLICLPILLTTWLAAPVAAGDPWAVGLTAFPVLLCSFVFATNQFHKWAHTEQPPLIARALQNAGLILGREHHQIHHTKPFDTYYCITTGWLNWPLYKLGFFPTLEWLVFSLSRIRAGRHGPFAVPKTVVRERVTA